MDQRVKVTNCMIYFPSLSTPAGRWAGITMLTSDRLKTVRMRVCGDGRKDVYGLADVREREREFLCVFVCMSLCVSLCVCMFVCDIVRDLSVNV